jgi:hypothetical protein
MTEQFAVKIADKDGLLQTRRMTVQEIYQKSETLVANHVLTNPIQVFNESFDEYHIPGYVEKYGTPFEQASMHSGLVTSPDARNGFSPPTLAQLKGGQFGINANGFTRVEQAGAIIAPDGSDALTVGGRMLFPMTVLQWVTSSLLLNPKGYDAAIDKLVAGTISVNGALYATPLVNFDAFVGSRAGAIAQLTEPDLIATITTSETSKRIKTQAYGLTISDQALAATTLDLVGLALGQFGVYERHNRLQDDLTTCVNGSAEYGNSALSSKTAQSYDAGITTAGTISHLAYLSIMHEDWMSVSYDTLLGGFKEYYAIERRSNRPTAIGDPGSGRIDISMDPHLMGMPDRIEYFETTPDLFGANTLVAIDSSIALRRVIDANAAYSAVERFVLQRGTTLIWHFGERLEPIFHDGRGWKKITLTV